MTSGIRSSSLRGPCEGGAIAYGNFRRLDRSAKRGAERPSFYDKQLIVERRSLRSALRASVETTGVAISDCSAREEVSPSRRSYSSGLGDEGSGRRRLRPMT